jgi:hypothetical protein
MKEISPTRSSRKQDPSLYTPLMVKCEMPEALRFFVPPFLPETVEKEKEIFQ